MNIVFIGDSLSYGYGVKRKAVWTHLIDQQSEDRCINKGVNGDTSGGMLARFSADVLSEKPDYVHIMGGSNDLICGVSPEIVYANIMALTQQAFAKNIQPIIGIPPKALISAIKEPWKSFSDFERVNKALDLYAQWLYRYSTCFNVRLIDYPKALDVLLEEHRLSFEEILLDGLHFNEDGNKLLASIFIKAFN